MEGWAEAVEASTWATALRHGRWSYAAVNTAHVLGVALRVGAAVPPALRLIGAWPQTDRGDLARVLAPVAAVGLGLALASGGLLFMSAATRYVGQPLLAVKLSLVTLATLSALLAHLRHGSGLQRASRRVSAAHGAVSLTCWLAALVSGRLLAYTDG